MPRTVKITHLYYITSTISYLLIRVFITNGPLQVIIMCVCERDQEEESTAVAGARDRARQK
jgi:hypothetical protein